MGSVASVVHVSAITVQIDGGPTVTVRLIGVEPPQAADPTATPPCFRAEAAARTAEFLPPGTAVGLEREIQDQDGAGRVLAYVWPADGRPMVNEQLIAGEGEAEDIARREAARLRSAERRFREETEALRREGVVDRGKRQLSAQQRRLEDAVRRRVEHGLELAGQRYLPEGTELRKQASKAADVIDGARAPLADWKNQRESLRTQLRDQIAQAKTDPELQEALRDDPTALDGIDEELDKALAVPDAWVERADKEAQRWSDRLRTPDTWRDRDRRLSVDRVVDGLEQLDRLRQRGRELAEARRKEQRKDERNESRRNTRRRERKASPRDDSSDARQRRREQASSTD
jgi:endonuclease YncB( thermonuclease family)